MNLSFYRINEKILPRLTLVLDVLNSGFGLAKYKIVKALEAYKEIGKGKCLDLDEILVEGGVFDDVKVIDAVLEKSKEEVQAAAAHGTRIHEMLEEHVARKGLLDNSIESKGFKAWIKEYKPKFIKTEHTTFHPELGYAGTLDLICEIKGKTWLVDYKTSNKLFPKNGLQLTGYAMAEERISDVKIDHIACLQLGKNKKGFYFKEYPRQDDEVKSVVKLFYWSNPNFVKNIEKRLSSIMEETPGFKSHTIPVENIIKS